MAEMDESVKFVWAYMIEQGVITDGEWEYYGGNFRSSVPGWTAAMEATAEFRDKVKKYGVDWSKTSNPVSSMESSFTDTFHEADRVETLLGTVVLNNGEEYMIGVGNAERRFGDYIRFLSELSKDKARVKAILGE